MDLFRSLILVGHLYLNGGWLGEHLKADTRNTIALKEIGLLAQTLLIISSSIVNMLFAGGGGKIVWPFYNYMPMNFEDS